MTLPNENQFKAVDTLAALLKEHPDNKDYGSAKDDLLSVFDDKEPVTLADLESCVVALFGVTSIVDLRAWTKLKGDDPTQTARKWIQDKLDTWGSKL